MKALNLHARASFSPKVSPRDRQRLRRLLKNIEGYEALVGCDARIQPEVAARVFSLQDALLKLLRDVSPLWLDHPRLCASLSSALEGLSAARGYLEYFAEPQPQHAKPQPARGGQRGRRSGR